MSKSNQSKIILELLKKAPDEIFEIVFNEASNGFLILNGEDIDSILYSQIFLNSIGMTEMDSPPKLSEILDEAQINTLKNKLLNHSSKDWKEISFVNKKGQLYFFDYIIESYTNESNAMVHFVIFRNFTHSSSSIENSSNLEIYRVLDLIPSMIGYWDKNLNNVFANQAYSNWFGKSPKEIQGKHISYVLGEKIYNLNKSYLENVLKGESQVFEREFPEANGKGVRYSIANYIPAYDKDGNVDGFVAQVADITAIKEAKNKVEKSEAELRILLQSLPVGVTIIDDKNEIIEVNPKLEELLKLSKNSIISREYKNRKYLKSDYSEYSLDEMPSARCLKEKKIIADQIIGIELEDKNIIWINVTAVPLSSPGLSVMTISTDITERRKSEIELLNLKRMLEQTSRIARVGAWELKPDTRELFWSDITKEIHEVGMNFNPPLDEAINYYKDQDSREKIYESVNLAITKGIPFDYEFQLTTAKNNLKWVRVIAEVIFENGVCKKIFGSIQDITALRSHELMSQRLFAIVDSSTDAIYGKDLTGKILTWNRGAEHLFGFTSEEAIGKSTEILLPIDKQEEEQWIIEKYSKGESIVQLETQRKTKFGKLVDLSVSISPIYDLKGIVNGASVVARDIHEQKTIQEELKKAKILAEQASIAKSDFLANMSHEIRTPLNGIIGFTDLLLRTSLDHTQKDYLRTVFQSANSLLDIVSDILDFSKIEAGKLELNLERTSLGDLADEVINIVRYQANQKQIKLRLLIDPELPDFVEIDPLRIKQIIVNLLSNAIKFTEKGKIEFSITVLEKISDDKVKIRISIKDTGIGIAAQNQSKIFEAFTQEDFSTTRRFGGTGLGLSISNQLLSLMDSKIQLESELGEGSDFFFDLILESSDSSLFDFNSEIKRPLYDSAKPYITDVTLTIMIVEDNSVNMKLAYSILRRIAPNSNLIEAKNGREAVDLVNLKMPDIIFMDIQMPELNGYEASKAIRQITGAKLLPIIAVTAGTVLGERERCLEAGMNDYISKPAMKSDFERMMRLWIRK
ncbi:MAG: PAS domain S-box protein [Leptospira sp.]|nr:PAS domain S-box protein [Leptospira sp.]